MHNFLLYILRKSYRIPADIHDYSQYIASYIHGRKRKEFIPQENVGSINTYNRLKDIPFSEHGSWIMLGRTNDIVDELRMKAREMGLGSFPDVELGEARLKASDCRKLAKETIDPI